MREQVLEILASINDEVLLLSDNDDLFELDIFDSLDMINLIEKLEKVFEITINPDEITLENINTKNNIIKLVSKKIEK